MRDVSAIVNACNPRGKDLSKGPFFRAKFSKNSIDFFLVSEKKRGVERFVFDMLSEWLLPGKRLDVSLFESIRFKKGKEFVAIKLSLEGLSSLDLQSIRYQMPFLSQEIKFGVASYYQGMQILELKGARFEEIAICAQFQLKALIHRFPSKFDYDIYPLMRQIALALPEKKELSQKVLIRILLMFYSLRKKAKEFGDSGGRFVESCLSLFKIKKNFEVRKVVGIALSISIKAGKEAFEKKHLAALIGEGFDPSSTFEFVDLETGMKQFYCQIDAVSLERRELAELQKSLKARIAQFIQPLARPIFMPRNEEEVMKSLVTLSRQIRLSNDIPQVMIQFDRQTEDAAVFRVLMARPLKKSSKTACEILERAPLDMKIVVERTRKLGMLRRKISKEAIAFTTSVTIYSFLREDGSLDLFRARHAIFEAVQSLFGEIRDFNGAMMGQQMAKLESIKSKIETREHQLELEHFFFSLHPIEFRALWSDEVILQFFWDFLKWKKGEMVDLHSYFASFNTEEEGSTLLDSLKKQKGGVGSQALFVKSSFSNHKVVGCKTICR
jgi:hypothetical protein